MQKMMYNSSTTVKDYIGNGAICGRWVFRTFQHKVNIFRLDWVCNDYVDRTESYRTAFDMWLPDEDVLYFDFDEFARQDEMTTEEYRMLREQYYVARGKFRRG